MRIGVEDAALDDLHKEGSEEIAGKSRPVNVRAGEQSLRVAPSCPLEPLDDEEAARAEGGMHVREANDTVLRLQVVDGLRVPGLDA